MRVPGGRTAVSALLISAAKRSEPPRRRVGVDCRDAAVKISHPAVNSALAVPLPEPLANTPVQTWETLGVTYRRGCGRDPIVAALESRRSTSAPRRYLMATTQSATSNATDGLQCLSDVATG